MKYLAISIGKNEPDQNTPATEVHCKVIDIDPSEAARYEKTFATECNDDYEYGADVELRPLKEFEDDWVNIAEVY